MKDRKFLLSLIIAFIVLSVVTIIPTFDNLKELGIIGQSNVSTTNEFEIATQPLSIEDVEEIKRLEKEIADYNNRISSTPQDSDVESMIKRNLKGLCETLNYVGNENDNENPMTQVQENIQKYVTENCFKNDILTVLNFSDKGGNFSSVELERILFADLNTENPKALALTKYDNRFNRGFQILDCEFIYDENNDTYLISNLIFARD